MTIVDLVRVLRRNIIPIMIGAVLGLALAASYVFTRPTIYTAQSKALVVAGDSLGVGDTISANSVTVQRAGMYAGLAGTGAVAQSAQKTLSEMGNPGAAAGGVSAASDGASPFIYVTATGATAKNAQDLANAAMLGIKSQALRLETFGKTKGQGNYTDEQLDSMTSIHVLPYQPAGTPAAPTKPNMVRNLLFGALAGAVIAAAFALIRKAFDAKVRTQHDVEALTDTSALAIVPESKELAKRDPGIVSGPAGEALRQLRTNLRFVSVDSPPRSVVVTSPTPGDGKSTVAANLARLMAAAGDKVILIDCDLRLPTQAKHFQIDGAVGLTQVVAGDVELADALVETSVPGLSLLPAGRTPPNPSELLSSRTMRGLVDRLAVDHIVILDAPPALAVTDAALVGHLADGVIIVTRMGSTHKAQLEQCAKLLKQANATLLGTVMNRASLKTMGDVVYGYGYGYGSYGNYRKYGGYYSRSTGSDSSGAGSGSRRKGRRRAKAKAK